MAKVTLKNVTRIYGKTITAVKDLNLTVNDKEFCVLAGPSGCGKTTILRMIAGLEKTTEGEIYIDDVLVNQLRPKDRDIAMVFQNYALYPHLTVYENLAFALKVRKYPKKEIESRVNEAAELLNISHLLKKLPKHLSGGEKQRVAVGRAIVRHPKVFLFDEPLSNLDIKLRSQMRTEIKKLHEKLQATFLYVTHDQVEAMILGDRLCVLKDGTIQQVDEPLNLYNAPDNKFVAGFLGTPPMNFIQVKIIKDGENIYLDEGTFRLKATGKIGQAVESFIDGEILLGIRPEDIHEKSSYTFGSLNGNTAALKVDMTEPMGPQVYLHFKTEKNNFTAAVNPHVQARANEVIEIVFDTNKIHLFDPKTDQSVI